MGTKISALTETGSAPTGAYYPLEYDNANYKISTETLRANLGGKYTEGFATSIGGTTVDDAATLTVTHNLGTEDVIVVVYVADDAAGTNAHRVQTAIYTGGIDGGDATAMVEGWDTSALTSNTITVQLGSNGYWPIISSSGTAITAQGSTTTFDGAFLKVVVLAAGNGGINKYVADWAVSHGGVTVADAATLTITHNLGTEDVIVRAYVNSSASDTNAQDVSSGGGGQGSIGGLYGACITSLSSNSLTLQLGSAGYVDVSDTGTMTGAAAIPFTDLFIKVVVIG